MIFIPSLSSEKHLSYKWKPRNKLTIDFVAKHVNKNQYDLYAQGTEEKLIKFAQTTITKDELNFIAPGKNILPEYYVVEYFFSLEDRKYHPIKQRTDKMYANFIDVAKDIKFKIDNDEIPLYKKKMECDECNDEEVLALLLDFVIFDEDSDYNMMWKLCAYYKITDDPKIFYDIPIYMKTLFLEELETIKQLSTSHKKLKKYLQQNCD